MTLTVPVGLIAKRASLLRSSPYLWLETSLLEGKAWQLLAFS
jgi:hypothetical protein